jgi:kynurenine aminotransferase
MIIVNTPHNPVGKVFRKSELEGIAAIAEEFNLLVMADEVVSRHGCLPNAFKITIALVRLPGI